MEKRIQTMVLRVVIVAEMLLSLQAVPLAGDAGRMEIFKVPFGYFELPVPKNWFFLNTQHLGERQYLFSPNKISERGLEEGMAVDAMLTIKIVTADEEQLKTPLDEIVKGYLAFRTALYKQKGHTAVTKYLGPRSMIGLDCHSASLEYGSIKERLFLGRDGPLLYEILFTTRQAEEQIYSPIFQEMMAGFRFLPHRNAGKTKTYRSADGQFSIELPAQWHLKERDDGKTAQVFLSREKVVKDQDTFQVGVTYTKIRRFSQSYRMNSFKTAKDIVQFWLDGLLRASEDFPNRVFTLQRVDVGDKSGILWERSIKPAESNFFIEEYHLALAKNDTLYDVILEAPVMEFEIYRNVFLQAIKSLKLL